MTLQSKSFIVSKGGTLERVTQFLEEEIGLNAYLVKNVKAVSLSDTQTQITLLYEKYNSNIIESIAPREGAIFNTGLAFDDFDLRFLFNDPIDYRSIQSGTFLIDGVGLDVDRVALDTGSNSYFLKVLASGSSFQTEDFHTYQVSTTNLRRQDGSSINYGPVGGYVFHSLSNAHIGDYTAPYVSRRRGKVAMAVVRLPKSIDPQQAITEFLNQRQISDDRLISYTPVSISNNLSDVYFIYISKLEPQIISGFPLNNSLLPDVSAPGKVTFVFNTPLDKAKLSSTDGLFSIESDFSTSTLVPASDVTLLDDLHTVEIDTSSYFTEQKIYSIIARPGLLGLDGLSKQKPEQWTIHISAYDPSTAGGGGGGDISQAEYDYLSGLFNTHSGEDTLHYTQADIDIGTGQITDLPPLVTVPEYLNLSGLFTGHTGETAYHFTQAEISITESQVSDLGTYATELEYTGHTGDSTIHFTEGSISLPVTQINNESAASGLVIIADGAGSNFWGSAGVGDVTSAQYEYLSGEHSGLSASFTGHTGDSTVHFTTGDISHLTIGDIGIYSHTAIDGHITNTENPHGVTVTDIGAATATEYNYLSGEHNSLEVLFTGHTGDSTTHYTQSEISIGITQIDSSDPTTGQIIIADGEGGTFWGSAGVGDVTQGQYDYLSGRYVDLSGDYTGHAADTGIHFQHSSINLPIDQINSESATDGYVMTADGAGGAAWEEVAGGGGGGATTLTGLDDTDITDQYYGAFIGYNSVSGQWMDMLLTGTGGIDVTEVPELKALFIVGNNPPSFGEWTGHTGVDEIHFTEASISITESQISDLGTYNTQSSYDYLSGITTSHTGAVDAHTGYILADGSRSMYGRLGSSEAATAVTDYIRKNESDLADVVVLNYVNTFIDTFFANHTGDLTNPHEVTAAQVGAASEGAYDYLSGLYAAHISSHINELDDLSDVSVVGASDGQLLVSSKGNWTNSGILIEELGDVPDVTISSPSDGDVIAWDGAEWSNSQVEGFLQTGNNLSDVADMEEVRRNTKTRYQIDDLLTYDLLNSTDKHGVGNVYLFSVNSESFMTGQIGGLGVMTATNGNSTTVGSAAARRMMSAASFDLHTYDTYYFRCAVSHTADMLGRFGLSNATFNSEDDIVDGAYFEFDSSVSANWYACTAASSSRTKTDTNIVANSDEWKWFAIQPSASGIYFYDADGPMNSEADAALFISTNIPATAQKEMRAFVNCIANGSAYRHMWMDKVAYPIPGDALPTGLYV